MYEFTVYLECAGAPVGSIDVGVDATLAGDDFDLNRVYVFVGVIEPTKHHRFERKSDYRAGYGNKHHILWREIPKEDAYYPAIMEELDRQRGDLIAHLMKEVA